MFPASSDGFSKSGMLTLYFWCANIRDCLQLQLLTANTNTNSAEYKELQRDGEEIDLMLNSALSRAHLEELDALRRENFRKKGELFNKNFGSIFSSRGDASSFAFNVRRISDLYCSRLDNFLEYPMDYRFYPQLATHMPHTHSNS